jgi:hypothetical protein
VKVESVLLSAPDIDSGEMCGLAGRLANCQFYLHTSHHDIALMISGRESLNRKAGRFQKGHLEDIANFGDPFAVIDFAGHDLGDTHNYYRDSRPVLFDMWATIYGVDVADRPFLAGEPPRGAAPSTTFWRCR